jgi:hypothetical protein
MTLSYSRLRQFLLALCVLLVAALAYEAFAPIPEWTPAAASVARRAQPSVAVYPFIAPPIEAFAMIDARPVFNPTRTPLQVSHDAGSGPGSIAVGDLALIGIIMDHGIRMALLRTPDKPLAVAVTAGGTIDEWEVVRIGSDRVVLRADGAEHELLLSANKAPAQQQTAPAARPVPAR